MLVSSKMEANEKYINLLTSLNRLMGHHPYLKLGIPLLLEAQSAEVLAQRNWRTVCCCMQAFCATEIAMEHMNNIVQILSRYSVESLFFTNIH